MLRTRQSCRNPYCIPNASCLACSSMRILPQAGLTPRHVRSHGAVPHCLVDAAVDLHVSAACDSARL